MNILGIIMTRRIFNKILDDAIKDEQYSYELYTRAVKKTKLKIAKNLLRQLADQELFHKQKLEEMRGNKTKLKTEKLSTLKPEELMLTPITEFRDLQEIIKFAIKKEVAAKKRYNQLAKTVDSEEARKLLSFLEKEEKHHAELLRELKKELSI